jgi:hypothetical protein
LKMEKRDEVLIWWQNSDYPSLQQWSLAAQKWKRAALRHRKRREAIFALASGTAIRRDEPMFYGLVPHELKAIRAIPTFPVVSVNMASTRAVAAVTKDATEAILWDSAAGRVVDESHGENLVLSAVSDNGSHWMVGQGDGSFAVRKAGTELFAGRLSDAVTLVAFSPGASEFAIMDRRGVLELWSTEPSVRVGRERIQGTPLALQFVGDRGVLAVGTESGHIEFFNSALKRLLILTLFSDGEWVAQSPSGAVAGSEYGKFRLITPMEMSPRQKLSVNPMILWKELLESDLVSKVLTAQ